MEGPDASPTSVLIAGPPETGQAELAFDALSRSSTVVAVAPSDAAAAVESWYEGRAAALRTVDPTDGTGEPLFRFCHLLRTRVERAGGRFVCTADAERFTEVERETLGELFDRRRSTRADAPVAGVGR